MIAPIYRVLKSQYTKTSLTDHVFDAPRNGKR